MTTPTAQATLIEAHQKELGELRQIIQEQQETIQQLQQTIQDLQSRLNLNSKNSSKPPSSDGLKKPKPKSLRPSGQNLSGGQARHKGHTLQQTPHPDKVIQHQAASHCSVCTSPLPSGTCIQKRQVFDLPQLSYQVTEHQILQTTCTCGAVHTGQFPADITAPVQYGPAICAAAVHLNQQHLVPVARTAELIQDLSGLSVSEAFVMSACDTAKDHLQSPHQHKAFLDLRGNRSISTMSLLQFAAHLNA